MLCHIETGLNSRYTMTPFNLTVEKRKHTTTILDST